MHGKNPNPKPLETYSTPIREHIEYPISYSSFPNTSYVILNLNNWDNRKTDIYATTNTVVKASDSFQYAFRSENWNFFVNKAKLKKFYSKFCFRIKTKFLWKKLHD